MMGEINPPHNKYYMYTKEQLRAKNYYEKNKEKVLAKQKERNATEERKAYMREYRSKNKEKLLEKKRKYYEANKEEILAKQKKYRKEWYRKNKEYKDKKNKEWHQKNRKRSVEIVQAYVKRNKKKVAKYNQEYNKTLDGFYRRYKFRANKAKFDFKLSKKEFDEITRGTCVYCGEEEKRRGIDRVDSNVGYIKENCVPCCGYCNMMKMKLDVDDFLNHIKRIYKHNI